MTKRMLRVCNSYCLYIAVLFKQLDGCSGQRGIERIPKLKEVQ